LHYLSRLGIGVDSGINIITMSTLNGTMNPKVKQDDLILYKLRKKIIVEIIRRRAASPHKEYELTEMEECELICMYIMGKASVDINKIVEYIKKNYYTS
jgi:hypothetical protein